MEERSTPTRRATRAHALKNCLAVVYAVNRLVEPELCERSRARLARSQDAMTRMLALIDEDLTENEVVTTAARAFVRADEVLGALASRVEDRAQAGRVRLFFHAGPGGLVGCAPDLVEALANLVLNAIEATPPGGHVDITTSELEDGSQIWSVGDTGAGIPGHVLRRLGRAFVTGREGGSGIGFAVATHVVEDHGGRICVDSIDGAGTLISIHLPATL